MSKCVYLKDEVCTCAECDQCADFPSERYCEEVCEWKSVSQTQGQDV